MMKGYYKQYDYIMGRVICDKAGTKIHELHLDNACLNYILGKCNKERCTELRRHLRAANPLPEEVDSLCSKLRKGADKLTQAKPHRGSKYGSSDVE